MGSRAYLNNRIVNTLRGIEYHFCQCAGVYECGLHVKIDQLIQLMKMKDRPNRRLRKRWDEK